ncbi:MAG: dihydroxyacetone kinase, C-terminal domain [Chloroflexi bacterium]|jgi:dihydroxyacetone kinase-like protein|nr:MAG: dihydroxyacetone kinase, C-terminal domain [Chloroflexota bacterium]
MISDLFQQAIGATANTISENAALLNELDAAVGDGDHGSNLSRGFLAVAAQTEELASLDMGEALQRAGMTLVTTVGGAAGPLYGTLLMSMGKAAPCGALLQVQDIAFMLDQGVAAVKQRGRSDVGEKTMLDVLGPVGEAFHRAIAEGARGSEVAAKLVAAAEAGVEATRNMEATKGRAAQLGERSIGHPDPGAMASYLLVKALCDRFTDQA